MLILVLVQNSLSSRFGRLGKGGPHNSCRTCASLEGGQEATILHCTSSILKFCEKIFETFARDGDKVQTYLFCPLTPLAYCKWWAIVRCPVLLSTFPCFPSNFLPWPQLTLKRFFWNFSSVEHCYFWWRLSQNFLKHPPILPSRLQWSQVAKREGIFYSFSESFLKQTPLAEASYPTKGLHFVDRNVWSSVCKQLCGPRVFLEQHAKNLRF